MADKRIERDSMGEVEVPEDARYGAQTQRAVDNFKIATRTLPGAFISALARLKGAAAQANAHCGALPEAIALGLKQAARQIVEGRYPDAFPVPVFQTGSGTSSNMNMNEVLANLASRQELAVHPNDHANCSQSSNDIIPSAIQVAVAIELHRQLRPALRALVASLEDRAQELRQVAKTGRTHLMDAMPLTLGQELGAWASQLRDCDSRMEDLQPRLLALPVGGSAVGTGVNVPDGFAEAVAIQLAAETGLPFSAADNPFSRMAGQDVAVECSTTLRSLAIVLTKINNDLRWMGSGPLSGLGEITLQALQPGSSIMPGKVNPVLPEAVLMAAAEIMGNDTTIAMAGQSGNFQLNVMLPLIADKLLGGIAMMTGACDATGQTVSGFTVNHDAIERSLASNPILVTALNRHIGYEAAAKIAKRCYEEKRPVIAVAAEETDLSQAELEDLLNPLRLTGID